LQRQLAELSSGRDTTPKLSIYTVAPGDSVITPAESVASSDDDDDDDGDIPPLAAGESLLSLTSPNTKAKAKIADLEADLEQVKRLNESLQNQLKEYDHLQNKFEQQKQDYESKREGLASQVYELQAQLQVSEAKLQEHLANDAVNEEEVEGLRNQVDELSQQCKVLKAQLQKANAENQRLKGLQTTPPKTSSSPKRTLHTTTSDTKLQFTSPTRSPISGSVKALQEKYHESIRLNQELQEKLHAQLNTTPPHYTPDSFTPSPGTSPRKQAAEMLVTSFCSCVVSFVLVELI